MGTFKQILATAVIGCGWMVMVTTLLWVVVWLGSGWISTPTTTLADGGAAVQQSVQQVVYQAHDGRFDLS